MIYNLIGGNAEGALNATTALNTIALTKGANILRVHDVKEAVEAVKVWDALTGLEKLSLKGHTGVVTAVAYTPDGKSIASVGDDSTLRLWNAATGAPLNVTPERALANEVLAASPDGPALRNPAYGSLAARLLYPEIRQQRPSNLPRSPIIGTDSPSQYEPSETPGVRNQMPAAATTERSGDADSGTV